MYKGLHAGNWPDLMTSKTDYQHTGIPQDRPRWNHTGWCYRPVVFQLPSSANFYNWNHTGRLPERQVHWDSTGTTLADASTKWYPSGNPVLIRIIGTHFQVTRKPMEGHWKHTGNTLATKNSFSSGIPVCTGVLSSRHTGMPLNYHWFRVRTETNIQWDASCWCCDQPVTSTYQSTMLYIQWGS